MDVVDVAVLEHAAEQMTEKIIGNKNQHHDGQPGTGGSSRDLQRQQDRERTEEQIPLAERTEERDAVDDFLCLEQEIDAGRETAERQQIVDGMRMVGFRIWEGPDREEGDRR